MLCSPTTVFVNQLDEKVATFCTYHDKSQGASAPPFICKHSMSLVYQRVMTRRHWIPGKNASKSKQEKKKKSPWRLRADKVVPSTSTVVMPTHHKEKMERLNTKSTTFIYTGRNCVAESNNHTCERIYFLSQKCHIIPVILDMQLRQFEFVSR